MKSLKIIGLLMFSAALATTTESFATTKTEPEMIKDFNISPLTQPIVSLEQAKAQLRIEPEYEVDDALITQMSASAEAWVKKYVGRELAYTLVVDLDAFGTDVVELSCLPDASLTKIEYISNEAGEYSVLPVDNYTFGKVYGVSDGYSVRFKGDLPALPVGNDRAVRIYMACACPEPVRSAILLRLADLYERREDRNVDEASAASVALLRLYKQNW